MLTLDLKRLLAYDEWANRETLASLEAIADPPQRSVKLLGHIVGAEQLWYEPAHWHKPGPVWPGFLWPSAATPSKARAPLGGYLQALTPPVSTRPGLRQLEGEPWTSRVGDVLTHVVLHSSHHRGQIASDIRAAGHEPPTPTTSTPSAEASFSFPPLPPGEGRGEGAVSPR
jgi:hypothetical protein